MTDPDVGQAAPVASIPDAGEPVGRTGLRADMSVTEAIQRAGSRLAAAVQLCEGIEAGALREEMVGAIRQHLVEAAGLLSHAEVHSYPPRPDPAAAAAPAPRLPRPQRQGPAATLVPDRAGSAQSPSRGMASEPGATRPSPDAGSGPGTASSWATPPSRIAGLVRSAFPEPESGGQLPARRGAAGGPLHQLLAQQPHTGRDQDPGR